MKELFYKRHAGYSQEYCKTLMNKFIRKLVAKTVKNRLEFKVTELTNS